MAGVRLALARSLRLGPPPGAHMEKRIGVPRCEGRSQRETYSWARMQLCGKRRLAGESTIDSQDGWATDLLRRRRTVENCRGRRTSRGKNKTDHNYDKNIQERARVGGGRGVAARPTLQSIRVFVGVRMT